MVGGGKGLGGDIKGQLVQLGRLDLRRLRYSKISCIWQLGIGFGEWFWPGLLVMRGENNGVHEFKEGTRREGRLEEEELEALWKRQEGSSHSLWGVKPAPVTHRSQST